MKRTNQKMKNNNIPFWDANVNPITGFPKEAHLYHANNPHAPKVELINAHFIAKSYNRLSAFFHDTYYTRGSLQRIRSKGKVKEFFSVNVKSDDWYRGATKEIVDLEEYKELERDNLIVYK